MRTVTVLDAKTHLSSLLKEVEAGEEVVIARGRHPVARLVPFHAPAIERRFGAMRGRISADPGFFDPLPEDELAAWEGG